MPTWVIIAFWVVAAVVAVGAYVERRRGHRYQPPVDPGLGSERAEFESRAQIRRQEGFTGM